MKLSGLQGFAIAFTGIAALGAIAYYLERRNRHELDAAVTDAFKIGGWLTSFFPDDKMPPSKVDPKGKYEDPTKEV